MEHNRQNVLVAKLVFKGKLTTVNLYSKIEERFQFNTSFSNLMLYLERSKWA
jgi:hypothetical protein